MAIEITVDSVEYESFVENVSQIKRRNTLIRRKKSRVEIIFMIVERTPSYMQPTMATIRCHIVGSEGGITNIRRFPILVHLFRLRK